MTDHRLKPRPSSLKRVAARWGISETWVERMAAMIGIGFFIGLVVYVVMTATPRDWEKLSRDWERLRAVGESVLPWALLGVGLAVVAWMIFYLWQAIPLIVILGGLGSLAMGWVGAFVGLCVAVVCATILLATQSILASMATLATPPCKECGAKPARLDWETGTKLCEECRESSGDEEEE